MSKLTLLGAGLTDGVVLFKAFAVLPVLGQPMSPQLAQLRQQFSFVISQL